MNCTTSDKSLPFLFLVLNDVSRFDRNLNCSIQMYVACVFLLQMFMKEKLSKLFKKLTLDDSNSTHIET